MPETQGNVLPFAEQIAFFMQKVNLPTQRWDDLWKGAHARGFMIAGATKTALLEDFYGAVLAAQADGETLVDFKARFNAIVAKHGWSHTGGAPWRARVIYNTNINTAYQAGRYQQMQTLRKTRPYWRYVHGDSANPRAQHLAWDGLVLPAEDAFWQTHYPPNGWGCSCRVEALSARDLRALKKTGPDKAPAVKTYAWKDARGGLHQIPVGIDPGWDYNVGEAAMGRGLAQKAAQAPQTGRMWQRLTKGDWQSAGRPEQVPLDRPKASLAAHVGSAAALKSVLQKALGGEEKVFALKQGDFTHRVLVNAEGLGSHLAAGDLERARFLPLLPEVLTDPYEVWLAFEQSKTTGRIALRLSYIKAFKQGLLGRKGMLFVANARAGVLEGWTAMPMSKERDLNSNAGRLEV